MRISFPLGREMSVTSVMRVRRMRLRSRGEVVGSFQSRGGRGESVQVRGVWQRRPLCGLGLESGFGFGDGGQLGLPALLKAAGDEPVLRFAQVEGAFGPRRRLIAGTFHS